MDPAFTTTISPGLTPNGYPSFDNGTGAVNAVALQSDGKIIAGGNISRYQAPAAGSPQTSLKRLNADGTLDASFDAFASTLADTQGQTEVDTLLVTAGDKIYVGGVFQSYDGTPRSGILRLNANGSLDSGFNLGGISNSSPFGVRYVLAIAEQPDGKVLVGGAFNRLTTDTTISVNNLVRLNSDGSRDTLFSANVALATSAVVSDIAVLPNGQILVAGGLNKVGGGTTPLLLRLNADGSQDTSFYGSWANEYGDIDELLVLPDGRVVIGGDFMFAGSSTRTWVGCLNADGSVNTTFMANFGTGPNGWTGGELVLQPDGTILAGGIFHLWNGQPRASIARLLPDGTLDSALAVPPYSTVHGQYLTHMYSFAVQPDGKIVAGGWFNHVSDPVLETFNLTRIMNEYDATGAGTLRMTSAAATTTELASSITIPVSRFGGLTGAVGVSYSITAGSAVAGTDYTAVSGTLSWAANEGGLKTITVPILPDAAADGSKTFTVTLSSPTGGATLPGGNASTVVTIRDDEGAPTITSSPVAVSLEQGGSFTLRMRYDSVLAATVQWQVDTGSGFTNIPGATSTSYTVSVADPLTHAGTYRAVVTNANGFANSGTALVSISVPAGSLATTFTPPADTPTVSVASGVSIDTSGRFLMLSTTGLRRMGANGTLEATTSFGIAVTGATQVLALPDGRTLIGGNLSTSNTHQPSSTAVTTGNRIIRLNSNATGTIDNTYTPTINGVVSALALGTGGKFYVGSAGAATTANGIQRFNADGTVDTTFAPVLNTIATGSGATVYFIKELPDGKILVSYTHGNTGSQTHRLSRLTSTGALDTTFGTSGTATFATYFNGLDVLPDCRIAVTTRFSNAILAGQQQYVGILSANGVPDVGFQFSGVFDLNNPHGVIYRDGRLLVWGAFTTVNGVAKRSLVRINLDGSIDNTFSIGAGADNTIFAAKYTSTGDIFIAGSFTTFKGVARNKAALLVGNPHIAALGFDPTSVTALEDAAPLSLTLRRYGSSVGAVSVDYATVDSTAVAGTDFTGASGTVSWADGDAADKTVTLTLLDNASPQQVRSFRVALSNASGPAGAAAGVTVTLVDDDTPANITTQPVASTSLSDTQSLALSVTATSPSALSYQWYRNGIAIPGATAANYNAASVTAADSGVYHVRVTNAAGTYLSTPSVVSVRRPAGRLMANQTPAGRPAFTSTPTAIVALDDGGVLLGGGFFPSSSTNLPQSYLIRVKPDGATDGSFNLVLNGFVTCLVRQPDGKILVGGSFTTPGGAPSTTTRLIRLNSNLTLDTAFNNTTGPIQLQQVNDVAVQPDGAIVVATGVTGGGDGSVLRITSSGALDTTFGASTGRVTANGNTALTLALMPDGDIMVAGYFTNIASSASARNRFARLNSDGSVDTAFNGNSLVGANGIVRDLLVTTDGRLVASGSFFGVSLCQVSDTGTMAVNMAGGSQGYQLAQDAGGKVLVSQSSLTASQRLFRLNAGPFTVSPGDRDTTFETGTGPDGDVPCLTVAPDGSIWIATTFLTFNGTTVGGVARLNGDPVPTAISTQPAATGVPAGDTAFIGVGAFGSGLTYQWYKGSTPLSNGSNISGATSAILSISNVSAGDVADYTVTVTGGSPSTTTTSAAARLYLLGAPVVAAHVRPVTIDATQTTTLSAQVLALSPATYVWRRNDGAPIVDGGRFSGATTSSLTITGALTTDTGDYTLTVTSPQGTVSTQPGYLLVRPPQQERASSFANLSATQQVYAIYQFPDGRMLVGGTAGTTFSGGTGPTSTGFTALAIVKPDGSYEPGPTVSVSGGTSAHVIRDIARLPDGKWLIAGDFTSVNGIARSRIARLTSTFTVDPAFNPGTGGNNAASSIAVDTNGKIYMGGAFTQYDGVTGAGRQYLVRLNADGTRDSAFTLSVSAAVNKVLALPGGGVLVGGTSFTPSSVFRLDASGALVAGFNGPAPGNVTDLALTPDGTAFYMGNNSTPYLSRYLLATGQLDTTFTANNIALNSGSPQVFTINSTVSRVAVQPDGRVIIAGGFGSPGFSPSRFMPTGGLDPTFVPSSQVGSNSITAMTVASSGRIWLGGSFTGPYGASNATRLLVLNGEVPPLAFSSHPVATQVEGGQTATFTAEVVSTTSVEYRWYKGATMLLNGGRISGASSPTLTITNVNPNDEGMYTVRATSATSGTITSVEAELIYLGVPEIVTAPVGGTFEAGTSNTLTVTARGAASLSYQWFKGNGTTGMADISGATSATYTLATPATTDTSYYGVRVTNSLGSASSTPVLVTYAVFAGSPVTTTLPTFSGAINRVIPLADGSFVAVGGFTSPRRHLIHALANGTTDTAFPQAASSNAVVDCIRDSQGRFIIVGNYVTLSNSGGNISRNYISRFSVAGVVDTDFVSPFTSYPNAVTTMAVDASDNVYVGGSFNNFTGFTAASGTGAASYLMRLNASTGTRDTTFTAPTTLGTVNVVRPLADGKVLVGCGNSGLVRLTSTGTVDATFTYSGGLTVTDIQPVPSSTDYIVCGSNGVQRITAAGVLITPWPTTGTASTNVTDLLSTSSGILVGGSFTTYNNVSQQRMAQMDANGILNSAFSGSGFNASVNSFAQDGSGRVWVAGAFTTYRGTNASYLVVLNGADNIPADPGAPPTALQTYLANAGIPVGQRGPLDDPDLDGLSNLLEYALDLPPNISSAAGLPVPTAAGAQFTLTYRRARGDVTYVVQTSTDLSPGSWTSVGVDQGTPLPNGTTTASIPLTGGQQFLRLSVSQ